jgi:biotin carboxyl carrier protein
MARRADRSAAHASTTWAAAVEAIGGLASDVVPDLIVRLNDSGLGELEVRSNGWRVRLRRPPGAHDALAEQAAGARPPRRASEHARRLRSEPDRTPPAIDGGLIGAPAVGYFVEREGVQAGARVRGGDVLGWIDVLGVREDVVAPRDGIIDSLEVAAGQAVEYGQTIARVRPGAPMQTSEG